MNIPLYYVIISIYEYKFIFISYRGNSGHPHPDLPSRRSLLRMCKVINGFAHSLRFG